MWAGHPDRVPPGLVVLYVVSVFGSGGKKVLVQFWFKYVRLRPENKKAPVICLAGCAVVVLAITTGKKKSSSRLSGGLTVFGSGDYNRKKKSSSHLSGGLVLAITTGK